MRLRDCAHWAAWIFTGGHDYRAAVRSLRRSPGFVAVAVLSLGVAIGINGTTFAMLDAVLEPFVPYPHAEQLMTVQAYGWAAGQVDLRPEMLQTILTRRDLFSEAVPWFADTRDEWYTVGTARGSARVALVAPGFVNTLGVRLAAGSGFAPYAAGELAESPAIVNYQMWRQLFAGSANFDRLRIHIDGAEHAVVGVMPPGVDYPNATEVWLRMPQNMAQSLTGAPRIQLLARMHPGDTRERVVSALDSYAATAANVNGLARNKTAVMANDLRPQASRVFGYSAGLALTAFLVLIVACLNVANVMAARGIGRRREIAVRVAIGATGGAIFRYVMAEAALLALGGGVIGGMLAVWGIDVVQARMPAELVGYFFRIPAFSWHVVVFIVVVTGVTVVLSGLAPALRARRADIGEAMKGGGYAVASRTSGGYRVVVSAQLVVSLMMAMAAAALLQSLRPPRAQVSPIQDRNVYAGYVQPGVGFCRHSAHPDQFEHDLVAAIAGVAGVQGATAEMGRWSERGLVTSDDPNGPYQVPLMSYTSVTSSYFRVRGVPLVAGRDFEPGDAEAGAAVVNLALAKKLWPLMSPVGRALKLGPVSSNAPWVRVVGVSSAPIETPAGEHFDLAPPLTVAGHASCAGAAYWARVDHDDPQVVSAIYRELRAALPGGNVSDVAGARTATTAATYAAKVTAFTYTGVALFMLLLSAAGVFGVMSVVVGQRRREYAVRVALGADARDVWRLVMRDAWIMALAGIGVGAFLATHFSPWGGLSVHLVNTDVLSLIAAEAAVVLATLAACVAPALRASRVDPVDVLRAS